MLWAWLLGVCLSPALTALTSPLHTSAPRLLNCTFMHKANITCRWEPGDPRPSSVINYTLYIQKTSIYKSSVGDPLICTTTGTECTVEYNGSVSFTFCINVTAHNSNGLVSSEERCQSGRKEVMLYPMVLQSVQQIGGRPQCLQLTWKYIDDAFSEKEITNGNLITQMEYSPRGQPNAQVSNVTVTDTSFVACCFKPYTNYTIRLRHRYRYLSLSEATPWSHWSKPCHGRTGEAAPAAAPQLWIQVNETNGNGWRHVVLLWKPLNPSLANGIVDSYNVSCQTSSSSLLSYHGSCGVMLHNGTSCSLRLPPERCKCFLTASNSAGTSPEAHIWLPGSTAEFQPIIQNSTVSSLDDNRLDVRWTAPSEQPVTGFVVEWSAVTEQKKSSLQWERLNGSCRQFIITEGVEPLVRYAVTVKALHGEQGAGLGRIHHVYTREGVPSAGPKVRMQEMTSNSVVLSWSSIPVEQQHGFIQNYTLHYTYSDGHTKRVFIAGDVHRYSLKNLPPGDYTICMQGNTVTGSGVKGPPSDFNIGSENADVLMIMILPVVMTSLAFALIACLAQNEMVKQRLCQDIPNPSHSSLAHWTPKALLENLSVLLKAEMPHIQQVVLDDEAADEATQVALDDEATDEATQQNSRPVEVFSYRTVQSPNVHFSHMYPYATIVPLNELLSIAPNELPIKEDNHYKTLLSPCDSTYAQVFTSSLPQSVSQALFVDCQYTSVGFLDSELQQGGDSEPHGDEQGEHVRGPAVLLSQADKLVSPPLSLSHLTNICHSFSPLPLLAEENSPHSDICPGHLNRFPISASIPIHRSEPEPTSLPASFSSACSPFQPHVMAGLLSSYPFISNVFSEDRDMYISAAI